MNEPTSTGKSAVGLFATRHAPAIAFICVAFCLWGVFSAFKLPSSVFPQTNFPRVVILADNGVMPGDEMMARITRPIEEAMKDIPGSKTIKSATGRGSAEISVFFDWSADMTQSELYVLSRLSQIQQTLPSSTETRVFRMTFSSFPIIGVSLTSKTRDLTALWEIARYDLKTRFLRIPGVARVDIVGGRTTEYHAVVDPLRLQTAQLSLAEVTDALEKSNLIAPGGMHEENHKLYLTVLDGRLRTPEDIEQFAVKTANGHPVRICDFARVERGPEPVFNIVTADGERAMLLNIRSQPDGSTLDIAGQLKESIQELRKDLPPDLKLAFFYDQSTIVQESVKSVWEAIFFGLILSVTVLYLFLKNWRSTFVAALVIPASILITLMAMKIMHLSFNLMTLGGIAAAIGLVIDDAIVVVEAIHVRLASGQHRLAAVQSAIGDIFRPLVASTLTPVVVFIPLAFLDGITGVFFCALAMTMVVSLLASLVLALTVTPSLAAWFMRPGKGHDTNITGGRVMQFLIRRYRTVLQFALRFRWGVLAGSFLLIWAGVSLYGHLGSEFLPTMDEGGFVIDYRGVPGTSLAETDRALMQAEKIIRTLPDVESYSRRTGARLALALAEPHTGDFLVKLKPDRKHSTEEVMSELRHRLNSEIPSLEWDFPTVLGDLIGDLMWAPKPIEVKLFSTDIEFLKRKAPEVEAALRKIGGVVDTFNGLVYTGHTLSLRLRSLEARRLGLTADDVSAALNTAMLGRTASSVLEGDRIIDIRVVIDPAHINKIDTLKELPLRTPDGKIIKLSQVADIVEEDGQLELRREDMRQLVAVTARTEGRDMGSAMKEIRETLTQDPTIPSGTIEFGGLYQQQQESFHKLLIVLLAAIVLVFTVLLIEFRSFVEPFSIVAGSILALLGSVIALYITNTSLNVISMLGAIIGIGIVAKNGILMLDQVEHFRAEGLTLDEALITSGQRRLRPVLMTSLTALLGMLPLAYGIGAGADMLKPLAIAIMGALCISVLLSLIATPVFYHQLVSLRASKLAAEIEPHDEKN
jgi:CzcA family heavy metal efflux pump